MCKSLNLKKTLYYSSIVEQLGLAERFEPNTVLWPFTQYSHLVLNGTLIAF